MARDSDWKPEDRLLYMVGEITDELAQSIVERVMTHWDREFLLVINSDGGSCYGALCIINLMRAHGRIDTLCIGIAESGAADTLASGRKRYIVPGTIAMLHQVSWELGRELASNVLHSARALEKLNSLMADLLAEATGKSRDQIDLDLSHDHYLYDKEIIEYGLADAFWDPQATLPPPRPHRLRGRFRAENNEVRQRAPREE